MKRLLRILGDPRVMTSMAFVAGILLGFVGGRLWNRHYEGGPSRKEDGD